MLLAAVAGRRAQPVEAAEPTGALKAVVAAQHVGPAVAAVVVALQAAARVAVAAAYLMAEAERPGAKAQRRLGACHACCRLRNNPARGSGA